jgi:hypothetical protein
MTADRMAGDREGGDPTEGAQLKDNAYGLGIGNVPGHKILEGPVSVLDEIPMKERDEGILEQADG